MRSSKARTSFREGACASVDTGCIQQSPSGSRIGLHAGASIRRLLLSRPGGRKENDVGCDCVTVRGWHDFNQGQVKGESGRGAPDSEPGTAEHQLSAAKYSASASGWNSTAGLIMEEATSLLADIIPRDGAYLPGPQVLHAAAYLLLPTGLHILVHGGIEAIDQSAGQVGALLCGKRQGFLQQFCDFLSHGMIILSQLVYRGEGSGRGGPAQRVRPPLSTLITSHRLHALPIWSPCIAGILPA